MAEYSAPTQARLDTLEANDPAAHLQLTYLRPFALAESDMVAQLDAYDEESD